MKAFHFPRIVVFFFFVLLMFLFYLLGAACYICSIASQNEEAVIAGEIVGDWVISPVDSVGQYFDGAVGRTPRSGCENFSIENASNITADLNETDGVKALAVAAVQTKYTLIVKGTLKTVDEKWLQRRSFKAIENRMEYDGQSYMTLSSFQPGDYYYDQIYGIDSEDLVSFFEDEGSYEFFGLTGRKGAFLSETIKEGLGLSDEDEYITLAVSITDQSSFDLDGRVVVVPIAGYFRVPDAKKTESKTNDWITRLSYDGNTSFVFLDYEYYSRIFTVSKSVLPEIDDKEGIYEVALALFRQQKKQTLPVGYQNIWIRGGDEETIDSVLSEYGENVALESSVAASIEVDRVVSQIASSTKVGWGLFILMTLIILFFGRTVVARVLDYEERTVLLLYASGVCRGRLVLRLLCYFIIPSFFLAALSFYAGIEGFSSNFTGYFFVDSIRVVSYMIIPAACVLAAFLLTVFYSVHSFVRKNTVLEIRNGGRA
jgi:hypothetical protein